MKLKIPIPSLKNIFDINDALLICGAILISKGLHMIYPPLAYIAVGLIVMWMGLPGKGVKQIGNNSE